MTKLTRKSASRPRRRFRRWMIPVLVALIAALGGIARAEISTHEPGPNASPSTSSSPTAHAPRATFTSPQAGATITSWPSADRVEGVLHGTLPKGWTIYFAVRPAGSDLTYPASAACDVHAGTVLCDEVYLGKKVQAPQTFYLEFWIADRQATAVLRARPAGADTPLARPAGASLTDNLRVTRR